MAEVGRREETGDPLAFNPLGNASAPQLPQMSIRNPHQTGGDSYMDNVNAIMSSVGQIAKGAAQVADANKDKALTEGKLDFMLGKTSDEIYKSGNKYRIQGWEALNSADQANNFVLSQSKAIEDSAYAMDPEEFKQQLLESQQEALKNLPKDPAVRKVYVDQWDRVAPQLIEKQGIAHNKYNKQQTENGFSNVIGSEADAAPEATRVMPGSSLRASSGVVHKPLKVSAYDRDVGIYTMLGEAAGEGEVGLAAVGFNMKNRAFNGGYGGTTISEVALAEKQYSTWNSGAGGNNPTSKWSRSSAAYIKAGKIFDAVMAGNIVDMTGGHLNYFSPGGMRQLVESGSQSNSLPKGYKGGGLRIGNHIFHGPTVKGGGGGGTAPAKPVTMVDPVTGAEEQRDYIQDDYKPPVFSNAGVVAQEVGVANQTEAAHGTGVYDRIMGYEGIPNDRKATLVKEKYIETLDAGSDQLFNDAGGLATLQELGATPDEIREVRTAHARYQKAQADKFNVANEAEMATLEDQVKSGKITGKDAAARVAEMYGENLYNSAAAQADFRRFIGMDPDKGSFVENEELIDGLTGVYAGLQLDDKGKSMITYDQAKAEVKRLAKVHNVPEEKLAGYINKVADMALSNRQKQITEFAALEKKRKENTAKIEKVRASLGAGYGLARLDGSITTVDPENGQETQVSSKQYGVNMIRQSAMNEANRMLHQGELKDTATAAMWAEKSIHTQLKKQDVVDEAFAAQVSAAARGTIFDAEKRVDQDTLRAFDWYLSMSKDPRLGPEYAGGYFKDTEAKALMLEASLMYGEGGNIEQALRKAHEQLNSPIPPKDVQIGNDYAAQKGMQEGVDAVVRTAQTDETSIEQWVIGNTAVHPVDRNVATNQVTDYMDRSAKAFHRSQPRASAAAAVKHATEKAKKAVVQIGDVLVFGDPERNERLDQRMGLQGLPRDSAYKAVDQYIQANIQKDMEAKGLGGVFKDIAAPFWKKELRQEGIGDTTFHEKATRILGGLFWNSTQKLLVLSTKRER